MNNERERMDQTNTSHSDADDKKVTMKLLIKVGLVVVIFAAVFSLIYFAVQYGEANFVLSNQEVTSSEGQPVKQYKSTDKVYFFISRNMKNLDSNLFIMEIEYFENGEYKHYKQISYELDKSFPDLYSYIPVQYFKRSGKYRIKASLDGKVVSTGEIEILK